MVKVAGFESPKGRRTAKNAVISPEKQPNNRTARTERQAYTSQSGGFRPRLCAFRRKTKTRELVTHRARRKRRRRTTPAKRSEKHVKESVRRGTPQRRRAGCTFLKLTDNDAPQGESVLVPAGDASPAGTRTGASNSARGVATAQERAGKADND